MAPLGHSEERHPAAFSAAYIHVEYSGDSAVFAIEDGSLLAGAVPRKQARLVQAWIELHREELRADWNLAANGEMPFKIEPLR